MRKRKDKAETHGRDIESGGCVVMGIQVQDDERIRVGEEKWWKEDEQKQNRT